MSDANDAIDFIYRNAAVFAKALEAKLRSQQGILVENAVKAAKPRSKAKAHRSRS